MRVQLWMLGAGALLAVVGLRAGRRAPARTRRRRAISYWDAVWTAEPHSSGLLEVVGSGGFALAVIGLCLLLCRTLLTWVVLPLRAVGAMPLTAYTAQLVIWAIAATVILGNPSDLRGFRDLEPFWPITVGSRDRLHRVGAADRARSARMARRPRRTTGGAAVG